MSILSCVGFDFTPSKHFKASKLYLSQPNAMSSLVYLVVHFKPHTCFLTALFFALKRELVVFRQEKHKTYYLSQNFTLPRQENSTLVLPCIFLFDPFYAKKGYSHGFNVLLEIHISKFSHNEDPVSLK